jgi:hypothetical protein
MTAQISDKIRYHDGEYSVVGWEGAAPFDPAAHALEPVMFSTGCWQGYTCVYEVVALGEASAQAKVAASAEAAVPPAVAAPAEAGDQGDGAERSEVLRLATVFIGLGGEQRAAAERGDGPALFGMRPIYSESDGCFVYDGLAAVAPYSGCLTLGADFVWDQYVHMGFHPPWKYGTVLDLTFAAGRLVEAVDRSEEMARLRAAAGDGSFLSLFKPLEPRP